MPNPAEYQYCDTCGITLTESKTEVVSTCDHAGASAYSFEWSRFFKLPRPGLVWDQPALQWRWSWNHIVSSVSRNKLELVIVVILTLVAGILRIYRLVDLPGGLHGDEALTGIDAMRILEEGWIGPYVGSALGQTAGPLYFTALIFKLSEPTQFTLHLSMALLGVATVPAAYFLFRIGFGRWVALFGAVTLTFSYWHLFYSRAAFMLISMPLMTTLASIAILIALRSKTRWAWFVAGVVFGIGVYSYNGYLMFGAVVAVALATWLILGRYELRRYVVGMGVFTVGFFIAAFPLIQLAYSDPSFYFQRHRLGLSAPENAETQPLGERIQTWTGRAWDAATLPFSYPEIDYSDGLGDRGTMNPVLGLLAYAGLIVAIAKWRSPPHLLLAVTFVLGLSVLMLGRDDETWGELRRSLIIVPSVYGLAGVAAINGVRWSAGWMSGPRGKAVAYAGATVILVVAITLNTTTFFGKIVQGEHMDWIYGTDLVDALDAAHEFDQPGTIYFYSERWSYDYETRRFLYPDTPGIDRSHEFGEFSLKRFHSGPVTYVLLPPYIEEAQVLRARYPGGYTVEDHATQEGMRFSIYHLQ